MGVREAQALRRELVDVRRLEFCCAVATDVAIAEIVGVDHHDVGTFRVGCPQLDRYHCHSGGQTEGFYKSTARHIWRLHGFSSDKSLLHKQNISALY